jgi:hypothetical protein
MRQAASSARSWAERLGEPCEPADEACAVRFGELQFFNVD